METLQTAFALIANSQRQLVTGRVRQAILEAYDGQCQYCSGTSGEPAAHVEHIIPINPRKEDIETIATMDLLPFGDTLDCLENLSAACVPCNLSKGNRLLPADTTMELLRKASEKKKDILFLLEADNPLYFAAFSKDKQDITLNEAASQSIHLVRAGILGETEIVKEHIGQGLFDSVYRKALRVSVYFGQYEVARLLHEALSKKEFINNLALIQLLRDIPSEQLTDGHFRIKRFLLEKFRKFPSEGYDYRSPMVYQDPFVQIMDSLSWRTRYEKDTDEKFTKIFHEILREEMPFDDAATDADYQMICAIAGRSMFEDQEEAGKTLRETIARGANVRAFNDFALYLSCLQKDTENIEILINAGSDHTWENYIALYLAIDKGDMSLFRNILERPVDRHTLNTALNYACGDAPGETLEVMITELMNKGAVINEEYCNGFTFLCCEPNRSGHHTSPRPRLEDSSEYDKIYRRGPNWGETYYALRARDNQRQLTLIERILPIVQPSALRKVLSEVNKTPIHRKSATYREQLIDLLSRYSNQMYCSSKPEAKP